MNKQYINIAIAGLSIHDSDELKHQLSNILPQHFSIQWKTASDVNLDCLFIHEHFYDTEGIQRILNTKRLPWLKISKNADLSGQVQRDTLYLPLTQAHDLNKWLNSHILEKEQVQHINHFEYSGLSPQHKFTEKFFHDMLNHEVHHKIHLYDNQGTLGILDLAKNLVWINTDRNAKKTDHSLSYDLASTTDLTRVSRKERIILQDWLWNLFWYTPELYQMVPEDGDYKIHFWPKPTDAQNRKYIFQLCAFFIQGANIKEVAEYHEIPILIIRQFIATNMAISNLEHIHKRHKNYTPPLASEKPSEEGFIKSFFGKLRTKFGF
jgi:hypothetical protein